MKKYNKNIKNKIGIEKKEKEFGKIKGALIFFPFPCVKCISFHLSTFLPDFTPQKSIAEASFFVVKLIVNSPEFLIIS